MLNGIDISAYQPDIDIAGLSTTDFVIIKATEGTSYRNACFLKHIAAAITAGKKVGVYHYATGSGHQAEADFFLSAVRPYIGKILIALDWESQGNNAWGNLTYAKNWLDYVKAQTGVTPVIYMSESVASSGNWAAVAASYKLWGAQYANYNRIGYTSSPWSFGGWGAWGSKPLIHQYTSRGAIAGYSGDLDLDLFYGTKEDWDKLCASSSPMTAGWQQDDKGWWYRNADGTYPKSEWMALNGTWYYFGPDGYMLAGDHEYNGHIWHFSKSGAYQGKEKIASEETNMNMDELKDLIRKTVQEMQAETAAKPGSDWSQADRDWAIENGIFQGDEHGDMHWQAPITREQVAAVLHRVSK